MTITDADLERLLSSRALALPPANFTARVMAAVGRETWRVEQAVDISFNLAIGIGAFLIVGGALALLWSLGLLGLEFNLTALTTAAAAAMTTEFVAQLRTVLIGAALLTTALAIWWWAEADQSL